MPFLSGPDLVYAGSGRYRTSGVTVYEGTDERFVIPHGFDTDLASVPRVFWALLPPSGTYERSAVLHDFLCVDLAEAHRDHRQPLAPSRDVDGLFRRVAREGGAGLVTRWLLWCGVRWGAFVNPARRTGWWRDLPLVAAISAASAAVLIAVLGAAHIAVELLLGGC